MNQTRDVTIEAKLKTKWDKYIIGKDDINKAKMTFIAHLTMEEKEYIVNHYTNMPNSIRDFVLQSLNMDLMEELIS